MYLPAQFEAKNRADAIALMRAYPLASLISVDEAGFPYVSHIPLHVQEGESELSLLGHFSRGNSHGRMMQTNPKLLVSFMGPHAYLSPRVYPDLQRVPTWNYLTVQCTVQATLLPESADKEMVLKHLIADIEPAYASQWDGLAAEYQQRMLNGIEAFKLCVEKLEFKAKLNQHRAESHAKMQLEYAQGDDNQRALAAWMLRLGLVTE